MANNSRGSFRFRVSDALEVPLRGMLLRLKLVDGSPDAAELKPGATIRLEGPGGETGTASVKAFAVAGGKAPKASLERYHQLDLLIPAEAARVDGARVQIGWSVVGG